MPDLTIGCHEITVVSPPQPVFKVEKPETDINIVLPVSGRQGEQGVPGPAGQDALGATDEVVASFIADPTSETRTVLVPVIDTRIDYNTEPAIDLLVLFDNGKA